eukprot:TRINITY_DN1555_c0_g1_i1.p1 TRINITY_DN1555_c0_g1~~TRINITY_DN1555_c0_g1_i1.p1  ORF type:complete len:113 (-),score=14.26 TRINITY_DN1555_c0_g1_i1:671-1009(-)
MTQGLVCITSGIIFTERCRKRIASLAWELVPQFQRRTICLLVVTIESPCSGVTFIHTLAILQSHQSHTGPARVKAALSLQIGGGFVRLLSPATAHTEHCYSDSDVPQQRSKM